MNTHDVIGNFSVSIQGTWSFEQISLSQINNNYNFSLQTIEDVTSINVNYTGDGTADITGLTDLITISNIPADYTSSFVFTDIFISNDIGEILTTLPALVVGSNLLFITSFFL